MPFSKPVSIKVNLQSHLGFWLVYFLLNFLRWGAYFNNYSYSFKSNLIEFLLHIPLVYFNIFFLIPRFVLRYKYIRYSIYLCLSLGVIYLLKTALTYFLISEDIWPEANREYHPFDVNHIVAVVIGELYVVAMASSIYLTANWISERERNRALKETQLKIKLKYLKTQIQPHFFFNTLNNLYSLSLEKSNKVPTAILKLSKLMEYVLYDIKGSKLTPLLKEIEYIENYIEIEKLRFQNVSVIMELESELDTIKVPPLLFISLVENAFKHGAVFNSDLVLKIAIKILDGKLQFTIINNFIPNPTISTKKGIGLINTRKRLKLFYKNQAQMKQVVKFNFYIVTLLIPLNNEDEVLTD